MNDNIIQRILDKTNGGLDIILSLVPSAEKCIDNNRHFKLRESEKSASATVYKGKNGNYIVKDFGGDGFSGSAINLYMYIHGTDLKTTLKILGQQYGAMNESGPAPETLMPKLTKRPATETEKPNDYFYEIKDGFSDLEIETLFAKAAIRNSSNLNNNDWYAHLRKTCAMYGVYALVSFTWIKDREAIVTQSTDTYPIFMIEGDGFKKIYQPKSLDKKYRFRYFGEKDPNYIFGYKRLLKQFNDGEKAWLDEKSTDADQAEGGTDTVGKAFKLKEVIICSGDRDSLNVASLGYNVIWLNSEAARLPIKTYNELHKMCEGVYNLPDLDATGVKMGHKLALEFLDLKTIQLPVELLERKDWRGNPCKDVRDYLAYYEKRDFEKLVQSALEYKFWDEQIQYDKNGKPKGITYVLNNVRMYNFLQRNGFYRIESKTSKNGYEYIRVDKNIVKVVDAKEVKAFVNHFLKEKFTADQKLRNTFYRSNQLKDESLDNLDFALIDFKYYDKGYQYLFFEDRTWKITPSEVIEYRAGEVDKMVWMEKVIPHKVRKQEPSFKITAVQSADESTHFDIEILNKDCLFLKFLVQTSRVHWRKELEEELDKLPEDKRTEYLKEHKYSINGPLLSKDEILEQKQHLVNKIFTLGYMLCRHKEKSKPWAPFLMDHKLSAEGQSNGGSGKTIFAASVKPFMNFLLIDGKNKSLIDDKHSFENVTEKTEIILIDDLGRGINLETFFSMITEGITVNPKYAQRFFMEYNVAPKIIFTSNYGVKDITSSAERRLIYCAFSDYYHNNSTGTYREDRTPANDFGKNLIVDFTPDEWNHYINTMASCLQFYMTMNMKINPPMDNVQKRNLQGIMGDAFMGWADVYFNHKDERLDEFVSKQEAMAAFAKEANQKYITPNQFIAKVEAWCKYYRYAFNPAELQGKNGRIIRRWFVKDASGNFVTEIKKDKNGSARQVPIKKTTEMIYIKTVEGKLDPSKLIDPNDNDEETGATDLLGMNNSDADDLPF